MKHVLRQTIDDRFGGILRRGGHNCPSFPTYQSAACALEVAHAAMGHEWSDKPTY